MEPTQCSETSAFNTQTPGKYPEDNSKLLQHGESLKSRKSKMFKSMDRAGHACGPLRPIHHSGNKLCKNSLTARLKSGGAPTRMNHK
jgi:hypothetical protein